MMDHFYMHCDSPKWFTSPGLYSQFVQQCPDGGTIVEVGCWKGMSSAYLTVEVINSGKQIKVYCVDTWLGNDEIGVDADMAKGTVYQKFLANMRPVEGRYTPLKMTSIQGSKLFEDNSIDIVFIDASHHYVDVRDDIIHWLPKVKLGGILSGHDIQLPDVKRAVSELLPAAKHAGVQCWSYTKCA